MINVEYVLQDRNTADKWALSVHNSEMLYKTTDNAAKTEFITKDKTLADTYWKWFIRDGELLVEDGAEAKDEKIYLEDIYLRSILWLLTVTDGVPTYKKAYHPWFKRSLYGIPLGLKVRKQIWKEIIFRVRHGNGLHGSVDKKRYQDRYRYSVPSSINNVEGQASRDAMAQATINWQTTLTDEQKAKYNRRAMKKGGLSGYNLYVGEYITVNA